jgi:hypothetical protein
MNAPTRPRFTDLPLWRLLCALEDAERSFGAGSEQARELADAVQFKLREDRRARAEGVRCDAR